MTIGQTRKSSSLSPAFVLAAGCACVGAWSGYGAVRVGRSAIVSLERAVDGWAGAELGVESVMDDAVSGAIRAKP